MASIIISRAGATTIFEILSVKKPNILIPLPLSASRGDQILNAKEFAKFGFSEVINQEELSFNVLQNVIYEVLKEKNKYIENMIKSEIKNPTEKIINVIKNSIKK